MSAIKAVNFGYDSLDCALGKWVQLFPKFNPSLYSTLIKAVPFSAYALIYFDNCAIFIHNSDNLPLASVNPTPLEPHWPTLTENCQNLRHVLVPNLIDSSAGNDAAMHGLLHRKWVTQGWANLPDNPCSISNVELHMWNGIAPSASACVSDRCVWLNGGGAQGVCHWNSIGGGWEGESNYELRVSQRRQEVDYSLAVDIFKYYSWHIRAIVTLSNKMLVMTHQLPFHFIDGRAHQFQPLMFTRSLNHINRQEISHHWL